MLTLENQVCSLEHAKRLEELGINKGSLFVYEYYNDDCYSIKYYPDALIPNSLDKLKIYSAFTVAELGEMLPDIITIPHTYAPYELKIHKYAYGFYVGYHAPEREEGYTVLYAFKNNNESDARAKMLIYLIENKLITVEEINKCFG